jgi:hypothetical protein
MVTDDYWEAVMMNTLKDQNKTGLDGIKLWNLIYPKI